MSAAGVPSSAEIRSQSEDISLMLRLFISGILSAAFSRTLLSGSRLSRTDMILDISFLLLNSEPRVSAGMWGEAAKTPGVFPGSTKNRSNRKTINDTVFVLSHVFSIIVVRPFVVACALTIGTRQTLKRFSVARELSNSVDQ